MSFLRASAHFRYLFAIVKRGLSGTRHLPENGFKYDVRDRPERQRFRRGFILWPPAILIAFLIGVATAKSEWLKYEFRDGKILPGIDASPRSILAVEAPEHIDETGLVMYGLKLKLIINTSDNDGDGKMGGLWQDGTPRLRCPLASWTSQHLS